MGASGRTTGDLRRRVNLEGLGALSNTEVVAVCLGGREGEALLSADRLMAGFELPALSRASPGHIHSAGVIPLVRSIRLAAAFELGRRVGVAGRSPRPCLKDPGRVNELLASEVCGLGQETFHVLLLDGKHRLRRRERISEGTLNSSLVHPREVFGPAIREGAAALIVAHNHPSGDPEPSAEDLAVTRRLIEAGRLLGVPLLDHVVIGAQSYVSIRNRIRFTDA